MNNPPLVLLVGPTAVGKTEIAIPLAEHLQAEIISADSRLFYRGMDIGTAKPTATERARVPHHLIDIADPDEIVSLAEFQRMARQAIDDIHARGRLPLLVGGTGQYVRAVAQGWSPPEVRPNPNLRKILEDMQTAEGGEWLHARLAGMDPVAAASIDPRNVRRTIRALEVILTTGRLFSAQRGRSASPYRLMTIGLTRPRPELYARIDARIEAMFNSGLEAEVKSLLAAGYSPALPTLTAIGYREVVRVLTGQSTPDQARVAMRRATRVFVRRQANWFKESDPHIHWFRAGDADVSLRIAVHVQSWIESGTN